MTVSELRCARIGDGLVLLVEANIFAGKVRTRRVFGFVATDLTCNATRVERTESDIRRDDMEYYYAVVQLTGGSTIIQDDRVVNFAAGDIVLLNSTRPVTFVPEAEHRNAQWLSLQLPRQNLVSHLGFEPQGGACGRRSAQASRLLCQLALDPVSDAEPSFASADRYMPLVVYDLLGALFAPPAPLGSRHNDKLFMRACQHHQEPLCRSGHLSARGGCRGGNFAALFAEAVHGPWVDMPSPHMFGPSGSCGASDRTPRVDRRQASRSAISPTLAAFATTRILREDSDSVSAPRRAPSEQAPLVATTHESAPTLGKSKGPLRSDATSARFGQREPTQQWATIPKVRNTPNNPMDTRVLVAERGAASPAGGQPP